MIPLALPRGAWSRPVAALSLLGIAAACGPSGDPAELRAGLAVIEIEPRDLELYVRRELGAAELGTTAIDDDARALLEDELRAEMLLAGEAARLGLEAGPAGIELESARLEEIASDFGVERRARHARQAVLADLYVSRELAPAIAVSEEEVAAALEPSRRSGARRYVVFRQIRLEDRAAADQAYRRVARQKEAFEEVAAEMSTAADLGATQQRALALLPEDVASVLERVPEGTVSRPVENAGAWFVFQVEARVRDPDPGQARERAEVRERLFREKLDRLKRETVARLAAGEPGEAGPGAESPDGVPDDPDEE